MDEVIVYCAKRVNDENTKEKKKKSIIMSGVMPVCLCNNGRKNKIFKVTQLLL